MKCFQLTQQVNTDGPYATIQAALPNFKSSTWIRQIIGVSHPIYSLFLEDCICYRESRYECLDYGTCYGLEERRQEIHGDNEHMAGNSKVNTLLNLKPNSLISN